MQTARPLNETELLQNLAWVQALARRLVADPAAAEEVAQETWVLALERPPRAAAGAGLRAWLARVTRTLARQRYRSERARVRREQRAYRRTGADPSALDVVARAEVQQRVVDAVLALEEPARSTVLLRYFDGLDAREIAARRGESPVAVRKRLSRAVQVLRARLNVELGDDAGGLSRALAPLAFAGGRAGTVEVIGGAIVSKLTWTVGVVSAAAVLGGVWLWLGTGWLRPAEPAGVTRAPGELAAVEPGADAPVSVPPDGLIAPEDLATARRAGVDARDYLVLDPERAPVSGARVVLCAEGALVLAGETDGEGLLVAPDARDGEGRLLVMAPGFAPQTHAVALAAGRHEVVLDRGAVVSGRILVSRGPPAERIPLRLFADVEFAHPEQELGLAWGELTERVNPGRLIETRADEQGAFRVEGLPDGASLELILPVDYAFEDQTLAAEHFPNSMPLEAPAENLTLRVIKRLAITGRVIQVVGREPVPIARAQVDGRLNYPESVLPYPHPTITRTDQDGRFRIALLGPKLLGGSIWIRPLEGTFSREVEIEPREVSEDWDLGDLTLTDPAATRTLTLHVVDGEGAPLPGAIAATGGTAPISAPTDAEGITTLAGVVPGLSTIGVYARGYEATDVAVPAEVPEVLEVMLPRGTLLELVFLKPDGELATRVFARIAASAHPYRIGAIPRNYEAYTRTGCSFYLTFTPEGEGVVARLNALREGRVVLNDLQPGLPLRLRVEGPFGHRIQEQDIAPLRPGEHRTLEVALSQAPRTLRGRVMDEAGSPLPGASVGVRYPAPDRDGTRSLMRGVEEDGSFEIANVYCPRVLLRVDADGFVPIEIEEFEVPVDGASTDFHLARAHVVTVTIEDEAGRRLPARVHSRLPTGALAFGQDVPGETGVYVLHGLPDEPVEITAYVHGAPHVRTHDPSDPDLLIRVPVLGRVEVKLHLFEDPGIDDTWLMCLVPAPDSGLHEVYARLDPTGHDPAVFPGVLPGRYRAVIRSYPEGFTDMQRFEDHSSPMPLEVRADRTLAIEVSL